MKAGTLQHVIAKELRLGLARVDFLSEKLKLNRKSVSAALWSMEQQGLAKSSTPERMNRRRGRYFKVYSLTDKGICVLIQINEKSS